MPRYVEYIAPDGGKYKVLSMYTDNIEREYPPMWFGAYLFFFFMYMHGISEDEARQLSFSELEKWVRKPCPEFLLKLYTETKKKEQEKLLRDKTVTFENMICWILHSGRIGGTFSQYSYHGGSGSLKGRAPLMIDASDENNIVAVGNTDLSQEALKHLVENQRVVMAQFVDLPDGRWYCFYRTHRGLAGRESGEKGSHLHFISSAYGIDREKLAKNFKNGECPTNGFHVRLIGFGDK